MEKAVGPQGDTGNRGQPLFVIDEGTFSAFGQVRFDVIGLVADILKHRFQVLDLILDVQFHLDRAGFRGGADLVHLGDLAHGGFQRHGDQLLDPFRRHARENWPSRWPCG